MKVCIVINNYTEKRLIMSGLNFKLYQEAPETKTPYIQLQVGKGKKKQPSVFMDIDVFEYIKGIIWNKYREFGNHKKINQINNDDWRRILSGFEEVILNLDDASTPDQLMRMLSIPNHLYSQKGIIFEHKNELKTFIKELTEWIETNLKKEKYILVIEND